MLSTLFLLNESRERREIKDRTLSVKEKTVARQKLQKEDKMKRLMIVLTVLFVFSISAFAQMSTSQGGGMMGGGWGWGMNSGWFFMIIIPILVILGIVYMMKRR